MTDVTFRPCASVDTIRQMIVEPVDLTVGSDVSWGRVDEDAAVAFAVATNDLNERYLRGDVVPPLFTASLVLQSSWESQERGGERVLVHGARGWVHGEHDVLYCTERSSPGWTCAGSPSHTGPGRPEEESFYPKNMITDIDGSPFVEHFWSNFHIGGTIDSEFGSDLLGHTFPEESRSRPVATRTVAVARDQAFRYAGVSGDHAGHTMDDEQARREGYPSKILQGMCTFSLCSAAIVDIGANGDTFRLRRLAGRFSAPAFPKRDLVIRAYDAGLTSGGDYAVAFEALQDGVRQS